MNPTHAFVNTAVNILQPLLIFSMLFMTFCRINPTHLRLSPWHGWLLLIQGGLFVALGLVLVIWPSFAARIEVEGAMLCLLCPTATAAAVITKKLGGKVAAITSYTILVNLLVAVLVPAMAPLVHPNAELGFLSSSAIILAKVFPLLLLPLIAALLIRYMSPKLHFSSAIIPAFHFICGRLP